jgi:hypothetical protein
VADGEQALAVRDWMLIAFGHREIHPRSALRGDRVQTRARALVHDRWRLPRPAEVVSRGCLAGPYLIATSTAWRGLAVPV